MTLTSLKEKAFKNPKVKAEYDRLGNTLTQYKLDTGKTWARIAAELSEHSLANDPDKMNRVLEGRVYKLTGGAKAKSWELLALTDYIGESAVFC